jgi:hypothetical protein
MSEPRKTIVINPDFLKLPMRGNRTRKANRDTGADSTPKPIKIRTEKPGSDKTIKRRALNYIRKQQEERYKRLLKGTNPDGEGVGHRVETTDGKTYADEFKSDFDDSLAFLQKLTDQTVQKEHVHNATLRQYPTPTTNTNSTLFQAPVLNQILDNNLSFDDNVNLQNVTNMAPSPSVFPGSGVPTISLPKPTYGCLKGGMLPTYRTMKSQQQLPQQQQNTLSIVDSVSSAVGGGKIPRVTERTSGRGLTPEQQRAELKQFLEKRKEEKQRIERVKRQRNIVKPGRKQKRTTTRTFRVGKSKHYPKVGVLIPNKTIRTQVLANKQKIRETPVQDIRKYLIKKGLIRVGSSCPNDVLRQMYESSMMMCGEIQNHNPDNLLYNYLNNAI